MKKKSIAFLILAAAVLATAGCKRDRIIPDDTLAEIFHDAFLANAYIGVEGLDLDSLEVYEPIFEHYGYTSEDVRTTVGNFSRRKSAKLGSVVNVAIERLEAESEAWKRQVVILDTIREFSVRTFSRTVLSDTLISVRKRADSTRLYMSVEPARAGTYTITYAYECDEDNTLYPREAKFWFEDEDGSAHSRQSIRLRKKDKAMRSLTIDEDCERLMLNLGDYSTDKRPRKRNLTIRNFEVKYKPTEAVAVDSLFKRYLEIKIFADEFMPRSAQDSLALPVDSLRVD